MQEIAFLFFSVIGVTDKEMLLSLTTAMSMSLKSLTVKHGDKLVFDSEDPDNFAEPTVNLSGFLLCWHITST